MVSLAEDFKGKIRLILSQVDPSASIFRTITSGPTSHGKGAVPRPEIDLATPGSVEVGHEQIILLKTLYAQCPEELKAEFLSLLPAQMNERNARVIIHTVLEIGHLSDLKKLLDDPKKLGLPIRRQVWRAIREKVAAESHRFTEEDLTLLETMRLAELSHLPEPRPRPRGIRGIPG